MSLRNDEGNSEVLAAADSYPLSRSKSNAITEHYSILRTGSVPVIPTDQLVLSQSPTSSSTSLPLPSVLNPVKKVLSTSTTTTIKSFLKKNLFSDQQRSPTEGPITKLARAPSDEGTISPFDIDDENAATLSLDPNKLGYMNEILLEPPKIPDVLVTGLPILRITRKKRTLRIFKVDLEQAIVSWNNGKLMSIDNIQQIRIGEDAENYREEYGISKEHYDTWISIIYTKLGSNKLKSLHLIARNKEEFDLFVSSLTKLVSRRRELMKYLAIPGDDFANIHWRNYISKENKNKDLLSFEDILKLTKRLHINCDDKVLLNIFKETDIGQKNALNFNEFQNFVKKMKTRPEIIQIFERLTEDSSVLSKEKFEDFVKNVQKQKEPDEVIAKWFIKYSDDGEVLTLDNFTNYLTSSYVSPTKNELEDLSRPLNEYYISSSHNTYLIGRQFGSSSTSIEGYIRALQRGCRSIELDVWDGDHGPVIRHGKLTSSIQIRDVLQVVRKYAFIFTPYPLFLSFEIHCKLEYQYKVRELILETLGDVLITKPLLTNSFSLPSPMDLKHKILVKVKRTVLEDSSASNTQSSSFTSSSTTTAYEELSTDESTKTTDSNKKKKRNQPKIIPELSDLGIYASGLKFRNFSLPESKTVNHVFSFSESSFNAMTKDPEKDYLIQKHNRRYLMRLYPSGYRYNSTNFSPIAFWNYGVQMVATNWQTYDLGQEISEAMFSHGKGSGYVLKPQQLRNTQPNTKFKLLAVQPPSIIKFKIEVISGQLLPRPNDLKADEPLNPYVAFELVESKLLDGVVVTEIDSGYKIISSNALNCTKPIYSNGFNPLWNYRFEGRLESTNGLDFIRFQVKTGDVTFAVNCLKLDTLNQGYRHIPLYDLQGEEYIFSTLFINVSYEKT